MRRDPADSRCFTYNMTLDDALAFSRYQIATASTCRRHRRSWAFWVGVITLSGAGILGISIGQAWMLLAGVPAAILAAYAAAVGCDRWYLEGAQRSYDSPRMQRLLGARTVRIDRDGLRVSAELYEWTTRWPGIGRMEEIAGGLVVEGPFSPHFFPRGDADSDYADFVAELRRAASVAGMSATAQTTVAGPQPPPYAPSADGVERE